MIGSGNNGKSTVLNALFGESLLPSGTTKCTGNVTRITRVSNPNGLEIAKLHRKGRPEDEWEEHALAPPDPQTPRIKTEWVTDETIDTIVVEHKHELLMHGVSVLDVPGCAASSRSIIEAQPAAQHIRRWASYSCSEATTCML